MSEPIYLDHNASTPVLPEVIDAMVSALKDGFGNPSSGHVYGRRARRVIEEARAQVATLIGSDPDEILFTSGGTEANNLAIRGVAAAHRDRVAIVTSVIEHPATTGPCRDLERRGHRVVWAEVDEAGRVRPEAVEAGLGQGPTLISVMHANNETGVIQPISEIAGLARRTGAFVHTDAAQSLGKVKVDVDALGVHLLSIAGHKLYAPKGVGALYVRRETPLAPVLLGAGHERSLRPGTENVASIAGLGVACARARSDGEKELARQSALRDTLWARLCAKVPGIRLAGHPTCRLPNTLNVLFPGVSGNALLAQAPGVSASTGSACHAGVESASAVLLAMGLAPAEALGAVRLSLGRSTSGADVEAAADALAAAWESLKQR